MELICVHKKMRQSKYDPKNGHTPIPLEFLDTQRKTIMEFSKEKIVTQEDDWRSTERGSTKTPEYWRGRTVFRILPGGLGSRTSVPAKSRGPARAKAGCPEDIVRRLLKGSGNHRKLPPREGTGGEEPALTEAIPLDRNSKRQLHLQFPRMTRIFLSTLLRSLVSLSARKPGERSFPVRRMFKTSLR